MSSRELAAPPAAFFAASAGYASLYGTYFYLAIALCFERRAVASNGPANRVVFYLL